MNESRQRRLLEGQSSTSRKLYDFVPMREAWLEGDIAKAAHNGHLRLGLHTVRACLLDMKDAGLVKETQRHYYQRVAVTKKTAKTIQPSANEATMSTTLKTPAPATSATPATSPLELLSSVATELTMLGVEFIGRIKALSARVDEVALVVEAQREADIASMAKVHQLQALMKDMVGQ